MNADYLLDRLDGVRRCGDGQYIAKCPAHKDRNPSLSISEDKDRLLVCCHAGCSALDIVQAIGLDLKDLFEDDPQKHVHPHAFFKQQRLREKAQAKSVQTHVTRLQVAKQMRENGERLNANDLKLEREAFQEVQKYRQQLLQEASA